MLKQRILTAIVLIPLVFAALWYLPNAVVAAIVGGLMLACCIAGARADRRVMLPDPPKLLPASPLARLGGKTFP